MGEPPASKARRADWMGAIHATHAREYQSVLAGVWVVAPLSHMRG